jgi:beta-lactam-binding protein with PASTA domain
MPDNSNALIEFLKSKTFYKHLGYIFAFFALILILLFLWLRVYTNHGQALELPNYTGQSLEAASRDAEAKNFIIVVDDSLHRVGVRGGIILDQNPKPGTKVKERRKIYVTISKTTADKIKLKDLPDLYGRNYLAKKKELEMRQIRSVIKGYKFDLGEPDYIMEAYYRGRRIVSADGELKNTEIEKGGTIEFILSKKSGGSVSIPDLYCKSVEEAMFMLESANLRIGRVQKDGDITSEMEGFVIGQYPPYHPDSTIVFDTPVDLIISDIKPAGCR